MNYFAIECNGQFRENVILRDGDGNVVFTDYLEKDYESMKYSTDLEEFVCAVIEACEELGGDQVALTLIGEDDVTEVDLDNIQDWDFVIDNNKDYETLKQKVLEIVAKIR